MESCSRLPGTWVPSPDRIADVGSSVDHNSSGKNLRTGRVMNQFNVSNFEAVDLHRMAVSLALESSAAAWYIFGCKSAFLQRDQMSLRLRCWICRCERCHPVSCRMALHEC